MRGRARHTGFKAVSTGQGDNKTTPTISPSPLMEEDQSLSQCLTREQRVKQDNTTTLVRHCGLDPPVYRDENDKAFTPFS